MSLKILISTPEFAPAYDYGGPIFSMLELISATQDFSNFTVFTSTNLSPHHDLKVDCKDLFGCEKIYRYNAGPYYLGIIKNVKTLKKLICKSDIVYVNSTYNFQTLLSIFLSCIYRKKTIFAPRGAIQARVETKQKSWKKVFFEYVLALLLNYNQATLHLTSEAEVYFLPRQFKKLKYKVIANISYRKRYTVEDNGKSHDTEIRYLFFSRIHPKKGIIDLLRNENLRSNINIDLVGPVDPNIREDLNKIIVNFPNITILDPVYLESEKAALFKNYDVLILPSKSENFGNVVVEAINYGLPVIITQNVPIKEVEKYKLGIVCTDIVDFVRKLNNLKMENVKVFEHNVFTFHNHNSLECNYEKIFFN